MNHPRVKHLVYYPYIASDRHEPPWNHYQIISFSWDGGGFPVAGCDWSSLHAPEFLQQSSRSASSSLAMHLNSQLTSQLRCWMEMKKCTFEESFSDPTFWLSICVAIFQLRVKISNPAAYWSNTDCFEAEILHTEDSGLGLGRRSWFSMNQVVLTWCTLMKSKHRPKQVCFMQCFTTRNISSQVQNTQLEPLACACEGVPRMCLIKWLKFSFWRTRAAAASDGEAEWLRWLSQNWFALRVGAFLEKNSKPKSKRTWLLNCFRNRNLSSVWPRGHLCGWQSYWCLKLV